MTAYHTAQWSVLINQQRNHDAPQTLTQSKFTRFRKLLLRCGAETARAWSMYHSNSNTVVLKLNGRAHVGRPQFASGWATAHLMYKALLCE
jgi:hypothetical protein